MLYILYVVNNYIIYYHLYVVNNYIILLSIINKCENYPLQLITCNIHNITDTTEDHIKLYE